MANLRGCCCGYAPTDPCEPMCSYDSSYSVSNLVMQLDWVQSQKGSGCDTCDAQYDGANVINENQWTVSLTQSSTCTITRTVNPGGACCYQGFGKFAVSWQLALYQEWFCCGPDNSNVCVHSPVISGTTSNVDFCYTVVCDPTAWNGRPGLRHILTVCNFPLTNAEVILNYNSVDCPVDGVQDCNSPPTDRVGLMAHGASFIWHTPLKPLDTILPGEVQNRICGPLTNCFAVGDPNESCLEDMVQAKGTRGPFSVYYIPTWKAAPDPCTEYNGTIFIDTYSWAWFLSPPEGINCISSGEFEDAFSCRYFSYAYAAQFPYIS